MRWGTHRFAIIEEALFHILGEVHLAGFVWYNLWRGMERNSGFVYVQEYFASVLPHQPRTVFFTQEVQVFLASELAKLTQCVISSVWAPPHTWALIIKVEYGALAPLPAKLRLAMMTEGKGSQCPVVSAGFGGGHASVSWTQPSPCVSAQEVAHCLERYLRSKESDDYLPLGAAAAEKCKGQVLSLHCCTGCLGVPVHESVASDRSAQIPD